MSEIVKYHNDMNKISFNGFNEKELNLFFSLCFKAKNIGTNEVSLSFSELRELSKGDINLPRFLKMLKNMYDKLITLPFYYKNENGFGAFILFSKYFVNEVDKNVTIKLSENFEYILNNVIGNFTKFDLIEFVSLKSLYSKNLFKLLKQWETTKEREFSIKEFRELLIIPETYRMSEIDKKVLNPIMSELPKYFPNLKFEKIKTGRIVTSLKFTWNSKKIKIENLPKEKILEISSDLNTSIEKAKKNRFIEKILTVDNIELLTEMFNEKELIKGLNWSYKEIKQEINSLNYLVKSIKTGISQIEKKLVIKNNIDSEIADTEVYKEIKKIDISENEYEDLYKKYLENIETKDNPYIRKIFDIANKNKYNILRGEQ